MCNDFFSTISLRLVTKPRVSFEAGIFSIFAGMNGVSNGHLHTRVMNSNLLVSVLQASKATVTHNSASNISLIIRREEPVGFKSKETEIVVT